MRRLIVYLNSEEVGELDQDDDGLMEFRYKQEWLQRPDAQPLSRSLPLQDETFKGNKARPFFAGILPEEGPRQQIASILGISERNDFAMLERIGGECAGAVSLFSGDVPFPPIGEARLRELSKKELHEIIKELPRRPLMAGKEGIRLSLAGAQDKLPVVVNGSQIFLPLGNMPSTHIIKPEPERFPGLVANEIFCMTLAKTAGLNVPAVDNRIVDDKPFIVVQRYDRITGEGGVVKRLHQEDFCQALGFPPERKYQQEGGPLLRDCIALLRDWSTTPVLDIREFVDGLIFNMLIGNADAHGKNYSMLYNGTERRLAPFYDLVCTLAWPELSRNLSMKIGQGESLDLVTTAHWQKMAQETRLGWPMIRNRMAELAKSILDAMNETRAKSGTIDKKMSDCVVSIISERATAMLQSLNKSL